MDALIAILPFALLLLLCPLMMFFMHRGQAHHADDRAELLRLRGAVPTASVTREEPTTPTAHH